MSKKDHSSEDKPKLFKKKHKRFLMQLFLLVVVVGSGFVLWKPEYVKNDEQRAQVESLRGTILGVSTGGQEKLVQQISSFQKVKEMTNKVPSQVTIGEKDIYVEDVVKAVSAQLEDLPVENYQKFRATFCADLVATVSAGLAEE